VGRVMRRAVSAVIGLGVVPELVGRRARPAALRPQRSVGGLASLLKTRRVIVILNLREREPPIRAKPDVHLTCTDCGEEMEPEGS